MKFCALTILLALVSTNSFGEDREPIAPLPLTISLNTEKVSLGSRLFHETRLSKDNTISCASCHSLSGGGADGKRNSHGIGGALGDINAPTVFNSGLNFRQFWNGRAATLEDQIEGPVQHPKEMGSTWVEVENKLKADDSYVKSFKALYPDGVTRNNVKDAIATFERSLITPNSPFDRYLRGEASAITATEKSGYQRFKALGCVSCHQGANVGGNMYQTMGVMSDYFKERGTPITEADLGRYNVTKIETDKFVFRVPSLRNVELTAPYFHDGSAATLEQAVRTMARYQLGRELPKEDVELLAAFLKTLTGQTPNSIPRLPASQDQKAGAR